jgi:hypothetical protein
MSATINWTIDWMQASTQTINGFTEVVLTCGWRCTGTETNTANPPQTFTTTIYNTCSFPEPQAGGAFTPYAQLTQSQVVGWCWENGVNQEATETAINNNLNLQINPLVVQPPLPWSA